MAHRQYNIDEINPSNFFFFFFFFGGGGTNNNKTKQKNTLWGTHKNGTEQRCITPTNECIEYCVCVRVCLSQELCVMYIKNDMICKYQSQTLSNGSILPLAVAGNSCINECLYILSSVDPFLITKSTASIGLKRCPIVL